MATLESTLTPALEDYLESIYLLVRERKVARVKDIAKARDVKMSSVTTAMKRLAELECIDYSRREYIELTPKGEELARRILARHDILRRFFEEVLQMSPENAEADACSMEHHLSNEGMDKLVRFFEFLGRCEESEHDFLDQFHNCRAVNPEAEICNGHCQHHHGRKHHRKIHSFRNVTDLRPGESGVIALVRAKGAVRQRLLDMGFLPRAEVTLERLAPSGDPVWIRAMGFQLSLRRAEAESILLEPVGAIG